MNIQFKRKKANSTANPTLKVAEPLYDISTGHLYLGDGATELSSLSYIGENALEADKVTTYIGDHSISDIFVSGDSTEVKSSSNVSSTIGDVALSDIFDEDGMSVKQSLKVTDKIGDNAISDIFEDNGATVKKATTASEVTSTINGIAISDIFEDNGTTVKNAKRAESAGEFDIGTVGSKSEPVYFAEGQPTTCNTIPTITLNGNTSTSSSFYAPTSEATGADTQVFASPPQNMPGGTRKYEWKDMSELRAGSATYDSGGNKILTTYASSLDISASGNTISYTLKSKGKDDSENNVLSSGSFTISQSGTVDKAGEADSLYDGVKDYRDGSYYLNASNISAGTLSKDRLPDVAVKRTDSNGVGNASTPVYVGSDGVVTTCNTIPSIELNGEADTSPSFYAPTYLPQNVTGNQVFCAYSVEGVMATGWVNEKNLSVKKLGDATLGNSTQPIYLSSGSPSKCSKYAGGTKVTLNGLDCGAKDITIYAPQLGATTGSVYAATLAQAGISYGWTTYENLESGIIRVKSSTDKRYLIGVKESTSSYGSYRPNSTGVYVENNNIYAANFANSSVTDTLISRVKGEGLGDISFQINGNGETNVSRYAVMKKEGLNETVGNNYTPVFVNKPGYVLPCTGGIDLVHDNSGTKYHDDSTRFKMATFKKGANMYIEFQFVDSDDVVKHTYRIPMIPVST